MATKILYKYRDWNNDNHKTILSKNEIYFCSAKRFNDPFDGRVVLAYDLLTKDERFQAYYELFRADYPNLPDSKIRDMANQWVSKGLLDDPLHQKKQVEFIYEKNINDFGIVSLSEVCDDILMWAHYANSHRGFCIGFNKQKLVDFRINALNKEGLIYNCYEVKYYKDYPKLKPIGLSDERFVIEPLSSKSKCWQYEKEHRLILMNGTEKKLTLPAEIFEEIILGRSISEDDKNQIIKACRSRFPHAKIYQAYIYDTKYKIGLDEIMI